MHTTRIIITTFHLIKGISIFLSSLRLYRALPVEIVGLPSSLAYDVVFPIENGGLLFGDTAVEILHINKFLFGLVMIVFITQNPRSH